MNFKRLFDIALLICIVAAFAFIAAAILSEDAEAEAYKVDLRVKDGYENDVSGLPGDKVKLYLEVENKGSEKDSYDITADVLPAGWKMTISPTTTSELDDGDEASIIVSVTIPEWANATDSVDFTVTATSTEDTTIPPTKDSELLTVDVDQEYVIALAPIAGEATTKTVDPGSDIFFLLNITNNGNGDDDVTFSFELPAGHDDWTVDFSSNTVTLEKRGDWTHINITVGIPNNEDAGKLNIQIIATSDDDIETSQQGVKPDVNYIPDFIVTPYGGNQKTVETLESVSYGLTLENKGNDEDTFQFSIVGNGPGTDWYDDGWRGTLDMNSITVSQDESFDIPSLLTVNAPDGLADDEAYIVINVTSEDGSVIKTLNTRSKILQDFDPGINIIGGTTKEVDPGEDVIFTVDVLNNGNGEDEITLHIKNGDQEPGSWGSWSDSAVTLDHTSNTTVTLTVTPPSDASYLSEGYTIEIYCVSEDGENESTHKTLKVNVNKKYDLSLTISGASTKKANPEDTIDFTLTVKNKGNYEDTILLTLYSEGIDWKPEWGSIVSSVDLQEDQTTNLTLSVSVPNDAEKADYKIGIRATSDEDPAPNPINKTAEVIVSVNQTYDILITIPASLKTVNVDDTVEYLINIKNTGTGNDTITLDIDEYPDGWQVNFDISSLFLGAKEDQDVIMEVETPKKEDHAAFFINFTATSEDAPETDPVVKTGSTTTTVNQTFEFDIQSNPDYLSVMPGQTIEFNITFENTGTGSDHIDIAKAGDYPDSWTVSIASQVAVDMGVTKYKTLTVSVDDETLKGEYHINITGTSSDDPNIPAYTTSIQITISVEQLYNMTTAIGTDTKSIDPFPKGEVHKVSFTFTVNNTGTGDDTFEFASEYDTLPARKQGWSVAFTPATVDLGVKEETDIMATVTVPDEENIGTYGITITVTSQGDAGVTSTVEIRIDVNQTYSLDLTTDKNTEQIVPSEIETQLTQLNFTLTVTNTGTGDDKYYLTLFDLPNGWYKNLAGNTGIIPMGDSKDFILNLKVPGREAPDTYNITVEAVSDGRDTVKENVTLQVVVNELHALDLTTNEPSKKANENNFTFFDVVVTNKGTGTDTFTFDYIDVPDTLIVSFPDGQGTDDVPMNTETTKKINVFVEDKTPKAKFYFNITVKSDEDESIIEIIMLTVDVNQSYELKASLTGSPPGNKVNPDDTVYYEFLVHNTGTGVDTITVEVPNEVDGETNVPAGWKITPIPYSFDLKSDEKKEDFQFEVEVDGDAEPGQIIIEVWFKYHDGNEKVISSITVIVNQTYDVGTNLNFALLQIYPGFNETAILTVKNTGTGSDYYKIEISDVDGLTATVNPSLTDDILPGDQIPVTIDFAVDGGEEPRTVTFWINVTSQEADEEGIDVIETSSIDIKIKETYGVSLNKFSEIHTVEPSHTLPGTKSFPLTVTNDGTSDDNFVFEFMDDPQTQTYKSFLTLPESEEIGGGLGKTFNFNINVDPYKTDSRAIADGKNKNITVRVYSKNARDNNVEIDDETTKTYLCQVNIEEYRYALITSITPSSMSMDIGDVKIVNVTIKSEGNGIEPYSWEKDGENGLGQNTDWYDFNVTSIELAPLQTKQVSIIVEPDVDADVGIHSLHFHAKSETTYETNEMEFDIDISEKFGGIFVSWDEKQSDPGRSVTMRITVRNTGNSDNTFILDDPNVPDGWDVPTWSGSNQKSINADSTDYFTLNVDIPTDYTKAEAGVYQFEVEGEFETDSGNEKLPGMALLNLTVNTVYGVNVDSDDPIDNGEPGDEITYKAKIKNTGNTNETYQLSVLSASGYEDASDWAVIVGADEGDQVTIGTGDTKFVDVVVTIPDFNEDNDEAEEGEFGLRLKAESLSESEEDSEIIFQLTVEEMFKVKAWADIPGKDETLKENDDTEMSYTITVRNLGNTNDNIVVSVPNDELSGDMSDWEAKFGSSNEKTLPLQSLAQTTLTLDLTIDKNTDDGDYTLRIRVESSGDTAIYTYTTIYINLSKATYGLFLEKVNIKPPNVNPSDESEIEYKFTLENIGNQDDKYKLEVESSLTSGTYKEWEMYFIDGDGVKRDSILIPEDLPDQADEYLAKGDRIDITLVVIAAIDEDEGDYTDITISAMSDNDHAKVEYLSFNLTVIKPNIEIRDDTANFYIEPNKNIEEGDDIDIIVTIYNTGTAETDKFNVWFYNGKSESTTETEGSPIAVEKVDNIAAGSDTEVLVSWNDIPAGENDIYVYADKPIKTGAKTTKIDDKYSADGEVLESKENDNYASIDDVFQEAIDLRPDLTVLAVDFDDKTAGEGGTTVTVTVSNVGSAKVPAGTATVKIKIKGDYLKDKKTSSQTPFISEEIAVNDDIDIEFKWDVPDEPDKNMTVKVTVDHDDDSESGNDILATYVVVEAGSSGIADSGNILLIGGAGLLLIFLLIIGFLFMKMKSMSAGGAPPPKGAPKGKGKGKPPRPGAKGKPGAPPKPGAKPGGPPKPGQKPITPGKGKPPAPGAKPGGPGAKGKPPAPGGKPGGPPGAKTIKCPKCTAPINITSPKRPIKVTCSKCGASGTINK